MKYLPTKAKLHGDISVTMDLHLGNIDKQCKKNREQSEIKIFNTQQLQPTSCWCATDLETVSSLCLLLFLFIKIMFNSLALATQSVLLTKPFNLVD